jgi:hypothetical protein
LGNWFQAFAFKCNLHRYTAAAAAASEERVHHGTLNVEGIVVRDTLVLLDRKSGAVYHATRRGPDGTHLRTGTWDAAVERVVPLTKVGGVHIALARSRSAVLEVPVAVAS